MRQENRREEDEPAQRRRSRRGFLQGLLVGIGGAVAAGVSKAQPQASATAPGSQDPQTPEPILYHRTEYMDRYFRTFR